MANVYAVKSGNWSDTTVWNTGALPTAADDVYSNNFTVTVDVSPTILTVRSTSASGIIAGGTFVLSNGITLTCTNPIGGNGSGTLLTSSLSSPSSAAINSNFVHQPGSTAYVLSHSGTGTINVTGNITGGGTNAAHVIINTGQGTINIFGNVNGTTAGGSAPNTISNSSTGTVNITGSVSLSGGSNGTTINNSAGGTVNVTGAVTNNATSGTACIINSSIGTIIIVGSVTNNGIIQVVANNGTGSLTINGILSAFGTGPVVGTGGASQLTYLTGPFVGTNVGTVANNALRWRWIPSVGSSYMTVPNSTATGYKNLFTADSTNSQSGQPATNNVRSGTVYGPNSELTGTCAVPPAGSVALGVPVDNTTGTAILTQANIQAALDAQGLTSARAARLDNLDATVSSRLDSTSYTLPPTPEQNATAVRAELSPELGRIDVATSTRSTFNPATDTVANVTLVGTTTNLTNPPDVPTTAEIADAVRVELTPELNNLDVAVSTRSTFDSAADTVAQVALVDTTTNLTNPPVVPTPEQIATAVRTELEPELDRIDANVTSRLAADDYVEAPTPEQNAEAVRDELEPELERIANCATVATTGEQIQDAWTLAPNN